MRNSRLRRPNALSMNFGNTSSFILNDKTLAPEQEQSLLEFGQTHGLTNEAMKELIDSELQDSGAIRISPAPTPAPVASSGERQSL